MMIVLLIIGTLSAIIVPVYVRALDNAKIVTTEQEMRTVEQKIVAFLATQGILPMSLDEIGMGNLLDSWGHPYQYLRLANPPDDGDGDDKGKGNGKGKDKDKDKGPKEKGKPRKDHFLVPINSDFDLYSMGPDGESRAPLTAKHSRDDIIRANNGGYFGPASEY